MTVCAVFVSNAVWDDTTRAANAVRSIVNLMMVLLSTKFVPRNFEK